MENHDPIKDITAGQIGKIQEIVGAALRKSGLLSKPLQQILENQGAQVTNEIVEVLRKYVEVVNNMIVRRVTVNRTRTLQEALDATCRMVNGDPKVMECMPQGEGEEVEVSFFMLGRFVTYTDLDREFEFRGLKPVDVYTLAAINEADPSFADDHPNCTQWKHPGEVGRNRYFATFFRMNKERCVGVSEDNDGWQGHWWFGGIRKKVR